ncbi:MAG: leucine-rich repeat protein, partial [Gaiellales bacterium]
VVAANGVGATAVASCDDSLPGDVDDFGSTANGLSWDRVGGEVRIGGYAPPDPEPNTLVIPAEIGGYPVTTIGRSTFQSPAIRRLTFTTVVLPNTLTRICHRAFWLAPVSTVTIPNSVTTIESEAFNGTRLTAVTVPGSVTSLGAAAFGYTPLESITFASPSSLGTLPQYALQYAGVDDGGLDQPHAAVPTLRSVQLPMAGLTAIGDGALSWKPNLHAVSIPSTVTTIGASAFQGTGLQAITIPSSVTSIGARAFAGTALTSVTLPSSITSISDELFAGSSLTSFAIPSSVTSIGDGAFANSAITGFTIPRTVATVGSALFESTPLRSLTVEGPRTSTTFSLEVLWNTDPTTAAALTSVTLPEGITTITGPGLANRSSLHTIAIPSTVTTIGDSAFAASGLTSIVIPPNVTTIGDSAFGGSAALSRVDFVDTDANPSHVTTVGDYAFNGTGLTAFTFPRSVTTLGAGLFDYTGLRTLSFASPSALRTLVGGTLANYDPATNQALTSVTLPEGLTTIDDYAFDEVPNLQTVNVPSTVTRIGTVAFSGCASLSHVDFVDTEANPSRLATVDDYAFSNSGLTSITLPRSVTTLGDGLFAYTPLETLTFASPSALRTLPTGALHNDDATTAAALRSVTLPEGLETIDDWAFSTLPLVELAIPASVTTIGEGAFDSMPNLQ